MTKISTTSAPTSGGSEILLTGSNIGWNPIVTIGGVQATVTFIDSELRNVRVVVPSGTEGPADIMVSTPGGLFTMNSAITYYSAPTLSSLSPVRGSTTGSTLLTLTGTHLDQVSELWLGETAVITWNSESSNEISFLSPPGNAGSNSVSVRTPGGLQTLNSAYEYITPQTVAWAPTNTTVMADSGSVTPNASASSDGDGSISYSVNDAGTAACTVDGATGQVSFSSAGSCVIQATAAQTDTYAQGSTTVTFTINLSPQTVAWAPTNKTFPAYAGSVTPNASASSDGDGSISYSVNDAGTAACTVDGATGQVSFSSAGSCVIQATAAQTDTYAQEAPPLHSP